MYERSGVVMVDFLDDSMQLIFETPENIYQHVQDEHTQ